MYSLNQVNKLVSCGRDPARSLPLWRGFLLIPLILVCFAFAPQAQAVLPAPDGGYPGIQHGRRQRLLFSTSSAVLETQQLAVSALFFNVDWLIQYRLLASIAGSQPADANTAVGAAALLFNAAGTRNTAVGADALFFNEATWAIRAQTSTVLSALLRSLTTSTASATTRWRFRAFRKSAWRCKHRHW